VTRKQMFRNMLDSEIKHDVNQTHLNLYLQSSFVTTALLIRMNIHMKIIPVASLWTKPINSQQLYQIPTVLTNTLQKNLIYLHTDCQFLHFT